MTNAAWHAEYLALENEAAAASVGPFQGGYKLVGPQRFIVPKLMTVSNSAKAD